MSYLDMVRRLTEASVPEAPKVAKKAKEVPATRCTECGKAINPDDPETWWGTDRVHLDCGKAAWRRKWRGELADAPAAAAH
jgi:hypothetical protein